MMLPSLHPDLLELKHYNELLEQHILAQELLYKAVDAPLAREISNRNLNHPKEMLDYLQTKFNVDLVRECMKGYRQMREITMKEAEDMHS